MLTPKKSLGQNFLIDRGIARRIVDAVAPNREDLIIEIGPGTGALTRSLVERAGKVIAIEIDHRLAAELRESINTQNFALVEGDALTIDFAQLALEGMHETSPSAAASQAIPLKRTRAVANLPYYVSTPIIERLLLAGRSHAAGGGTFDDLTLMLQKEVVDRMTSGPGGKLYGYLSVLVAFYSEASRLFDVPPQAFKPVPKVDSSVVRLRVLKRPAIEVADQNQFFEFVKAAFAQRRKTILNNLRHSAQRLRFSQPPELALARAAIDPSRRAETLSLKEFGTLFAELLSNR